MQMYPWWTEEQKKFAQEIEQFATERVPRAEELFWTRTFPMEIVEEAKKRGYFGAGIPEEYAGLGLGCTGACIACEQLNRMYAVGHILVTSYIGGLHQILHNGTEEQKQEWLTKMAKGQLGAVCITEVFAGSDAASVMTTAEKDGDEWIINGKKRFTTTAGPADRYLVYAKTSEEYEVRRKNQHITTFVVEKGTPGFHLEKVNPLVAFDNLPNSYLDFEDVRIPDFNRIGPVGGGWNIMMTGLNFERLIGAAAAAGALEDVIKQVIYYVNRRVQFRSQIGDFQYNQFKIADMITKQQMARLITFYSAYIMDQGQMAAIESGIAKMLSTDYATEIGLDAIQLMGGDGLTRFYPAERLLREGKIGQIVAGTNEVQKLVIYRMGSLAYIDWPYRLRWNEKLETPTLQLGPGPWHGKQITEDVMLSILAEDYRCNPGLYMAVDDCEKETGLPKDKILELWAKLEEKGLIVTFKDRRGNVILAKANYKGIRKAYPLDHFKWFPDWFDVEKHGF
ncbi:MAG: acyl-CoA dehydrogenase family protein [Candidatus Jordarchaeum sp.]|uniref:acyl-CoA dehydrogenase family protein n=1 Tax=Candidatus Jordarchaeum sp. TaxID=2823881 RepID=UPI00404B17AE